MPIILPSNHARIGAWVNSKISARNPLVYCTIPFIAMQGYHTKTEDTGSLDYNSICYITFRVGRVSMKFVVGGIGNLARRGPSAVIEIRETRLVTPVMCILYFAFTKRYRIIVVVYYITRAIILNIQLYTASAATRPRVAVPGETNLPTQVTTDTTVD